jgi:ATP-dependent exoDNAse (exonuclease V) alpha subunit
MARKLNEDQAAALRVMLSGGNCFLTGKAGTGKTFLLTQFISQMEEEEKNLLICAPTGAAALRLKEAAWENHRTRINAFTIHRAFKLSKTDIFETNGRKPHKELVAADVVIIDEISMCRIDLFEYLINEIDKASAIKNRDEMRLAKKEGRDPVDKSIQVIVTGDFYQLEPVLGSRERELFRKRYGTKLYAFEATAWKLANFHNLILRQAVRTGDDLEFDEHLNLLRSLDDDEKLFDVIDWFDMNTRKELFNDGSAVSICGKNKTASSINELELSKIDAETIYSQAELTGDAKIDDSNAEENLYFKEGARVMMLVNGDGYVNGQFGTITNYDEDDEEVTVKLDGGRKVTVSKNTWTVTKPVIKEEKKTRKDPDGIPVLGEDGKQIYDIVEKLDSEAVGAVKQYPFKLGYAFTIHKAQGMTLDCVNFKPEVFAFGQLYVALSRVRHAKDICINGVLPFPCKTTSKKVIKFYHDIDKYDDSMRHAGTLQPD